MMVIKIVYTVRDAKGKEATTEVKIPITISLTNAITFATAMAVLIDALMKGQIVNISIVVGVQLSGIVGIKTVPERC